MNLIQMAVSEHEKYCNVGEKYSLSAKPMIRNYNTTTLVLFWYLLVGLMQRISVSSIRNEHKSTALKQ